MQKSMLGGSAVRALSGAAVALVACSTPMLAQFGGMGGGAQEPMVRVGFGGGVTVPVSDAKDFYKNGMTGTGFLLVRLLGGLPSLRFAFTYDRFDFKPDAFGGPTTGAADVGHSQVLGGTAGIKVHLIPGPIRPFVMAGLGAFNIQDVINATSSSSSTTASKTNFGVDGGAGIEIRLGRLSAFAEGRIQNVYTQSNGLKKLDAIQSVPVTFGIMF